MSSPFSLELEDTGKGERKMVVSFTTTLLKNYSKKKAAAVKDSLWYLIQVFEFFIKKYFFKLFLFSASLQDCIAVLKDTD